MTKEIEAYKEFIDEAVSLKESVVSQWVRKGAFPEIESNKNRNEILASLSETQLEEVASIVQEAKESGVHDLLVMLNDNATINYKGTNLPKEPFGTEPNFDFVARSEGDQWPE